VRDIECAMLFDLVGTGRQEDWTERAFLQPAWDRSLVPVWRSAANMLPRGA
jgi:hypothetical protein